MKKLMMLAAVAAMAVSAQASEWRWSWWVGDENKDKKIEGCQIGIASECKEAKGAQVSLLWGRLEKLASGCQFACGYANAAKIVNGCQVSVVNVAREGAALQIGLLNWNPKGFLPFFPFFNFSTKMYGNASKK